MYRPAGKSGSRVALCAAFVLLLQAFAAGWAAGATPVAPTVDAFGNVLCVTSVDHEGPSPGQDHGKMPNCCTFGCSSAVPFLDTSRVDDNWLIEAREFATGRAGTVQAVRVDRHELDPASPRAPPVIR